MIYRNILVLIIMNFIVAMPVYSFQDGSSPILIVGASYANGKFPFNEGTESPMFGSSISFGSYLDMGSAISHRKIFVVNEAQAGATTFERLGCNPGPKCGSGKWDGYDVQFQRAVSRVANPFTGELNAKYVLISMPNDCLHADAFGIPQEKTQPCTSEERYDVATRLINVGMQALSLGLTPVYSVYPEYDDLDLEKAVQLSGILWEIQRDDYNDMRETIQTRIERELPDALLVNSWKYFRHIGDGIHPDKKSVKSAVMRILLKISEYEHCR